MVLREEVLAEELESRKESIEITGKTISTSDSKWHLELMGINDFHDKGIKGQGMEIAIIESNPERHVEFEGKVVEYINCYTKGGAKTSTSDCEKDGHGGDLDGIAHSTQVIGTIIAKNTGIAPNAKIYSVSYTSEEKKGNLWSNPQEGGIYNLADDFQRALKWAIEKEVDVISVSQAFIESEEKKEEYEIFRKEVDELLEEAYKKGIIIVASSGNGDNNGVLYPARNKNVIAVGAAMIQDGEIIRVQNFFNKNGDRYGSNYGRDLDFLAPGFDIATTKIGDAYDRQGGTSIATPIAAGYFALLKQYYKEKGIEKTNTELIEIAKENSIQMTDSNIDYEEKNVGSHYYNEGYGYGMIHGMPNEGLLTLEGDYNYYNYPINNTEPLGQMTINENGSISYKKKWNDWYKVKNSDGDFVWINIKENSNSESINGTFKTDSKGYKTYYLNPDGTTDWSGARVMSWIQEKPFVDYSYDYIKNNYDYKLSEEVYKYYRLMGLGDFYDKQTNEMIGVRREFLQKYKKLDEYGYWYDDYDMDEHYEKGWVRYTRIDHTNVYNIILKDSNNKTYFIPIISSGLIEFDVGKQSIKPKTNAFIEENGTQSFKPIVYWIKPNSNLTVFSPNGLDGGNSLLYANQIDNIEERKNIEFLKVIKEKLGRQDLELVEVLQ